MDRSLAKSEYVQHQIGIDFSLDEIERDFPVASTQRNLSKDAPERDDSIQGESSTANPLISKKLAQSEMVARPAKDLIREGEDSDY
mmetsp:Transcript_1468/g.2573  ORF Transcript_1468/g.2573 Transcript_1468/m.2573 type:complete len:86 (+) Transcript_1468:766-1023(+)